MKKTVQPKQADEVRAKRIARIARQVKQGTYLVPAQLIAKKLLRHVS